MSEYKVGDFTMDGGELDTFYKLFWFGSQDDGDLPSKSGMMGLIDKGLATKNYQMPDIFPWERPNGLSVAGTALARTYYHEKYRACR